MINARVAEGSDAEAARRIERAVFLEESYPYDYHRYDRQSIMFGAFEGPRCVGALRLIEHAPVVPPILAECRLWNKAALTALGGSFEELGTQAVDAAWRNQGVGLMLLRAAYQSLRRRGVTAIGFITEPEYANHLNSAFHFTCRQIGDIGYLGWACAPYLLVLDDVEESLAQRSPEFYAWVTDGLPPELLSVPLPDRPATHQSDLNVTERNGPPSRQAPG